MIDKIAILGKLAAKKKYSKPRLVPPKRRGSSSKLYKVQTRKEREEARRALNEKTDNVQNPYRYGRKKT